VDPASQAEYLRHGGWFGSLELTMLRASFNNAPAFSLPADMPLAPRYIVGLESAGGLGARARFWRFDNEYQAPSQFPVLGPGGVFPSFGVALTADRFDMDFYRHLYFSRGELIFGASIAAASIDVSATAPYWLSYVVTQSYSVQQSGGGAGVFLEGRHQLSSSSNSEWSFLSHGRWSALVTEITDTRLRSRDPIDTSLSILEGSLGLEYKRKFRSSSFYVQYFLESQSWQLQGMGGYNGFPTNKPLGFLGSTIGIGFSR
jgi:hypothetical protein